MRFSLTGIVIFLIITCSSAQAQFIYKGTVEDSSSNFSLKGAVITINDTAKTVTDKTGSFKFEHDNDSFLINISHAGYITTSISSFTLNKYPIILLQRNDGILSEVIVKAYNTNSSLINTPAAVSLLKMEDMTRYNNVSFLPALNTVPGVKMEERSPGSYRLSVRGSLLRSPFGVRNIKVYWNEIPFTDAGGNTYLNLLSFDNIDNMEIIKGPAGSMYGATTGGVLLLSGKEKAVNEKNISLNTIAGSFGLLSGSFSYNNDTTNRHQSFIASHQQSDGYREQTNMRRDAVNYAAKFLINNKFNFYTNIFYSNLYYQTPGGLTLQQAEQDPKQARPAGGGFESAIAQKAAIYLENIYVSAGSNYNISSNWDNTTGIYISNTKTRNPAIRNYERKSDDGYGARTVFQYKKNIFKLRFGAEYQYGLTNSSVYGNHLGNTDTLQTNDKIKTYSTNLFLQGDIQINKKFIINAGLSYNNYSYDFTRLSAVIIQPQYITLKPQLMPRFSLLYKLLSYLSLYGTICKGYSPPTINEVLPSTAVFNNDLNPEQAINYEAGFKGDILYNKLSIDLVYYKYSLKDAIVSRRDSSGAEYFINAGEVDQSGLEFSTIYYPLKNTRGFISSFKCWINYSNVHAKFNHYKQGQDDYSGNRVTGIPYDNFNFGCDIITKPGIYANLTYTHTARSPLSDANLFFSDAFDLYMVKTGYKKKISKRVDIEIFFSVEKSFGDLYSLGYDLNAAGNRFYNPASPENYYVGSIIKIRI